MAASIRRENNSIDGGGVVVSHSLILIYVHSPCVAPITACVNVIHPETDRVEHLLQIADSCMPFIGPFLKFTSFFKFCFGNKHMFERPND